MLRFIQQRLKLGSLRTQGMPVLSGERDVCVPLSMGRYPIQPISAPGLFRVDSLLLKGYFVLLVIVR